MVYAVIQFAVVILAVKHMMMVFTAQLVTTVQAVVVQLIMQPDIMVLAAQLPTIAVTAAAPALRLLTQCVVIPLLLGLHAIMFALPHLVYLVTTATTASGIWERTLAPTPDRADRARATNIPIEENEYDILHFPNFPCPTLNR